MMQSAEPEPVLPSAVQMIERILQGATHISLEGASQLYRTLNESLSSVEEMVAILNLIQTSPASRVTHLSIRFATCLLNEQRVLHALCDLISDPRNQIRVLELVSVPSNDFEKLARAFQNVHCKISSLTYSRNHGKYFHIAPLLAVINTSPNHGLKHLDLSFNGLNHQGDLIARALGRPFGANHLMRLSLAMNPLSSQSLMEIIKALIANQVESLESLDLYGTLMLDSAVSLIAEGILTHPSNRLKHLRLGHTHSTNVSAETIARALTDPHNRLSSLDLSECHQMTGQLFQIMAWSLQSKHNKLRDIKFSSSSLTYAEIQSYVSSAEFSRVARRSSLRQIHYGHFSFVPLDSTWFSVLVTLLSTRTVPRLLKSSAMVMATVPWESFIRRIAETLAWPMYLLSPRPGDL